MPIWGWLLIVLGLLGLGVLGVWLWARTWDGR